MSKKYKLLPLLFALIAFLIALPGAAEESRFSAGGYLRVAARPDFQGGWSQLGLWNISGRLLNEKQWAALEGRLMLLEAQPGTNDVWTSVHAKVEGGSVHAADILNGSLGDFALTQLYVKAGNVLLKDVVWQIGTIDYFYGDLGLYDLKLAEIFYDTIGLSLTYNSPKVDVVAGIGDAGYLMRGSNYNSILTMGLALRFRPVDHFELGIGGQYYFEPSEQGNENAPHTMRFLTTDGVSYESYVRNEVVSDFAETRTNAKTLDTLYNDLPTPEAVNAHSFKLIGYVGFGGFKHLKWDNFYIQFLKLHPEVCKYETFSLNGQTRDFRIYVKEWTDDRYQLHLGNEMQLELVPKRFDLTWAGLLGYDFDKDDTIRASENNRLYWSLVARGQVYLVDTVHLLVETSFAQEKSLNGNLWRLGVRSVGKSMNGFANAEGLEYGDTDTRNTWQGKLGFVINPTGTGIFARPSLRLLYGVQYSNVHNAFPNSFTEVLNDSNEFFGEEVLNSLDDRHWHHVLSIEAEAWF